MMRFSPWTSYGSDNAYIEHINLYALKIILMSHISTSVPHSRPRINVYALELTLMPLQNNTFMPSSHNNVYMPRL